MKTAIVPSVLHVRKIDLEKFRPVNETLATEFLTAPTSPNKKTFGIVDLWACRTKRKMNGIIIR